MTVYVDEAIFEWRGKRWCHMTATTHDELHAFAKKLALKRLWFQDKVHHQHYDLTERKRSTAIRHGAVSLPTRAYLYLYHTLPISGQYGADWLERIHARFQDHPAIDAYADWVLRETEECSPTQSPS